VLYVSPWSSNQRSLVLNFAYSRSVQARHGQCAVGYGFLRAPALSRHCPQGAWRYDPYTFTCFPIWPVPGTSGGNPCGNYQSSFDKEIAVDWKRRSRIGQLGVCSPVLLSVPQRSKDRAICKFGLISSRRRSQRSKRLRKSQPFRCSSRQFGVQKPETKQRNGDQNAFNEVCFVTSSAGNPLGSRSGGLRNNGGKRPDRKRQWYRHEQRVLLLTV